MALSKILPNELGSSENARQKVNAAIVWVDADISVDLKSSDYTATSDDGVLLVDATATMTLPAAADVTGKRFAIKNVGTATVTIDGNGSETIDGATTKSLASQYDSLEIVSDGSNWHII